MQNSFKHVSIATKKALEEMKDRKDGKLVSVKTGLHKLDKVTMNGFEWNTVTTLGGRSGSGKSLILEQIKRGMADHNPGQDIAILSFEYEMLPQNQVFRNISAKTSMQVKDLLSVDKPITDEVFEQAKVAASHLDSYPMYYIDTFKTVNEMVREIYAFHEANPDKRLVVTIDHILLTKKKYGNEEKGLLDQLCTAMIALKKDFNARDKHILVLMVSQLNRDVSNKERILNPKLHYPVDSDLFGSSYIFQASDYVIITQNPSSINGLGDYYGPPIGEYKMGLPVYCPEDEDTPMIYHHLLKNRMNEPGHVMSYRGDFHHSKITPYNL